MSVPDAMEAERWVPRKHEDKGKFVTESDVEMTELLNVDEFIHKVGEIALYQLVIYDSRKDNAWFPHL